jgi:hypothetical protein
MKRLIVGLAAMACIIGGGAAIAAASSGPEINNAKATIQLGETKFAPTRCAGVDGVPYITLRGVWRGAETAIVPPVNPYSLTGPLTIGHVVWTINLKTDRGVLRGIAVLVGQSPAGASKLITYAGPLTLITQGLPNSAAHVTARGWINAATYTGGKTDGGSLLANVEFAIGPGLAANGEFGGSMGLSDYSVTFNNQVC